MIEGTKGLNQGISLPEKVKMRIPECEWMHNPDAWNPEQFFKETSDYLYDVYGIGSAQERHLLACLTVIHCYQELIDQIKYCFLARYCSVFF